MLQQKGQGLCDVLGASQRNGTPSQRVFPSPGAGRQLPSGKGPVKVSHPASGISSTVRKVGKEGAGKTPGKDTCLFR